VDASSRRTLCPACVALGCQSSQYPSGPTTAAVGDALKALLKTHEAPYWLYHASGDYTGKTDVLVPSSAPMVEEIAKFW
jgi:hypothetical protein